LLKFIIFLLLSFIIKVIILKFYPLELFSYSLIFFAFIIISSYVIIILFTFTFLVFIITINLFSALFLQPTFFVAFCLIKLIISVSFLILIFTFLSS